MLCRAWRISRRSYQTIFDRSCGSCHFLTKWGTKWLKFQFVTFELLLWPSARNFSRECSRNMIANVGLLMMSGCHFRLCKHYSGVLYDVSALVKWLPFSISNFSVLLLNNRLITCPLPCLVSIYRLNWLPKNCQNWPDCWQTMGTFLRRKSTMIPLFHPAIKKWSLLV